MKRIGSLVVTAGILLTSLSGCYFLPAEEEILTPPLEEPEAITYRTHTVGKGDIEYYIQGKGYLVSTETETVQFGNVSGKLREIYVKNGDTVTEGQLIAELETGDLSYTIQEQEINVRIAEANLKNAKSSGNANSVTIAECNLELANLRLERSISQRESSRVYASMDGVIVYRSSLESGDSVSAYQPVCSIADPEALLISFSHNNIDELVHGMEMSVSISGLDEPVIGKIVQVPSDLPSTASDADKKSVKIELKAPDGGSLADYDLKLGDSVSVSVLMDSRKDVVVLSAGYVNKVGNRRYVKILKDGIPEERDVEVGLQSGNVVEIVSGLEVGDVIVI